LGPIAGLLTALIIHFKGLSWKWWYSQVLHAKGLAVVVAFDMHFECREGELDAEWEMEKLLDSLGSSTKIFQNKCPSMH
jgi:hypothetical protein